MAAKTQRKPRFEVALDPGLEPAIVIDTISGFQVYGSPDQDGAEYIAAKLNKWHDEKEARRQKATASDAVDSYFRGGLLGLFLALGGMQIGCAPLPAEPPPGDPGTVCGILVGGTDGGGTYTPAEACAAIIATVQADPFCEDGGHHGNPSGCPATLGYDDGGKCSGAAYFCATGVDSIRSQIEATACDVAKIRINLTCYIQVGK